MSELGSFFAHRGKRWMFWHEAFARCLAKQPSKWYLQLFFQVPAREGRNRIIDCIIWPRQLLLEAGLVLIKGTLAFNSEAKILSLQRPTFILVQGCDRDLWMSGMIKKKHGNCMSSYKLLRSLPNVQEIPHSTHPYGSAGEHFYQHMAPWKWRFCSEFLITIGCYS